ncbi:hypothetical protein [Polaribacter sejongensis]|uniref:hypothetical protein n=1 Tax=Polaribacter sejongensis TaxID=985043 RepID=UPI0030F6001D
MDNIKHVKDNSLSNRIFNISFKEINGNRIDSYYNSEYYRSVLESIKNSKYPVKKLIDITDKITDGTHHTPNYISQGARFISVKNIKNSSISFKSIKHTSFEEGEKLERRVKPRMNDILLTKIGTIGKTAIIREEDIPFNIFVSLALIRPNQTVSNYYLSEVLGSSICKIQFTRHLKGVGVPDLHLENIATTLIPFPSLDKQIELEERILAKRKMAENLQIEANNALNKTKQRIEKMLL